MGVHRRATIVDADGVTAKLRGVDTSDSERPHAIALLPDGSRVRVPFDVLEHHDDGGYTMSSRWSDYIVVTPDGISVPVIDERVTVDVRAAPASSVRARRRIVTETRDVEVPVWHERIDVERIPVDVFVERAPEPHYDGDTLVIPCIEEVPVVEVRLRVREELRVRVVRERRVHRETLTVRRHELDIDSITNPPDSHRDDQGEDL